MLRDVPALIAPLLYSRCPPAISRLIVSVVIWVTVERCPVGTLPHIGEKIDEFPPLLANANSTTSPLWVSGVIYVITPLEHCLPRTIGRRPTHPVNRRVDPVRINVYATTGLDVPKSHISSLVDLARPAPTLAKPHRIVPLHAGVFDDRPSVKRKTNHRLNASSAFTVSEVCRPFLSFRHAVNILRRSCPFANRQYTFCNAAKALVSSSKWSVCSSNLYLRVFMSISAKRFTRPQCAELKMANS